MGEQRPFFWLYENVVSMRPADKQTISRFLQVWNVNTDWYGMRMLSGMEFEQWVGSMEREHTSDMECETCL